MPDRITRIVPTARTVPIGNEAFPVGEATLADLAAIQAWLDSTWPDPLDDLGDDPSDAALFAASDRSEEGPPALDEARGRALQDSPEGVGILLAVALVRGTPGLRMDELAGLAETITPAQLAKLRRVFWGVDSAREIARILIGPVPEKVTGEALTWGEAIDDLARSHRWTYPEIYALTVTEFRNARRHGKPVEGPVMDTTTAFAKFADLERRRRFIDAGE